MRYVTEGADHQRLVAALRRLAPSVRPPADGSYSRKPAIRVIDCVLSLHRNYDRFVLPRLDLFERKLPEIRSISELKANIATYASVHQFVIKNLNYKHEARAVILGSVVSWLATVSGDGTRAMQLARLERWARSAPSDGHKSLSISGFGLAGFQYLRMLFGANTTKPDFRICDWVKGTVGHSVSPLRALRLLERAAPEAHVYLHDVDATIWGGARKSKNRHARLACPTISRSLGQIPIRAGTS
jgi:hypothetical protein